MNADAIGKGLYTPRQVAKLVNLRLGSAFTPETFSRWISGYQRSGKTYPSVIRPDFGADTRIVSFVNLIELMFIGAFRHHDISLPVIRGAARGAARRFETDHPFAVRRFRTDGQSIFADLERRDHAELGLPTSQIVEELHRSQIVFADFVEPYLEDIDWGDVEAQAYWPCGRDGRIVLDPSRSFGQPVDIVTGVPTEALYSFVAAGDDPGSVADWYEVPLDAVERAVAFEHALRAA